jgi:outer membrane protein
MKKICAVRYGMWVTFFALIPFIVLAQSEEVLTLDEAVRLALENNKTLQISFKKVEAADVRRDELNTMRLPLLRFQGGYTRLSDVDPFAVQPPGFPTQIIISPIVLNTYSTKLSLQQALFTGFRMENTVSAASHLAEASQHEYANDRSSVVYATKAAYWNLFKAMEVKRVVSENVEQVKAHLRDVQNFIKQGLATQSDVLKVQVQLSNSRLLEIDADNSVKIATMALNNLIGRQLELEVRPASTPESDSDIVPQQEQMIRQAMANRSDLMAMQSRLRAGGASVEAARGAWYPEIYLTGNYYYARPNPRVLPTKDEFKDTWDVGIGISLDVWNWTATSKRIAQAQALLAQTQFALEQLTDGITLEVTQNYLEVLKAREKLAVAAQAVEHAEENFRITKAKFAAGLATNTDFLDSEVELLQAKTNHIVVRIDCEIAKAKLSRSIGE